MNFKDLLDEVKVRGEKLKGEILDEIVNSKALAQIVSNKSFVQAVGRVIETKDEVKKVLQKQMKNLFQAMDVPTKNEFSKIGAKLSEMENSIEKLGIQKVAARSSKAKSATKKTATKARATGKKKSARKK
jgi:polyhydroxyalkanoate synthesis regulator phasin